MAKHNETGVKGEQIAEKFLLNKGYTILELNRRFGKKEVDIIASKDGATIFVEVKCRKSSYYGHPEAFAGPKKQAFLREAAESYLLENEACDTVQFDVLSIIFDGVKVKEIVHFENAFC